VVFYRGADVLQKRRQWGMSDELLAQKDVCDAALTHCYADGQKNHGLAQAFAAGCFGECIWVRREDCGSLLVYKRVKKGTSTDLQKVSDAVLRHEHIFPGI
jgi:hypothetical protein